MFAQILLALLALRTLYSGIIEHSIFDIIVGFILIVSSAAMFYAALSGSSLQEEFLKWRNKNTRHKTNL